MKPLPPLPPLGPLPIDSSPTTYTQINTPGGMWSGVLMSAGAMILGHLMGPNGQSVNVRSLNQGVNNNIDIY